MKSVFQSTAVRLAINQDQCVQRISDLFLNLAEIMEKFKTIPFLPWKY